MEEGKLQVLLVNAHGIKRSHSIGKSAFYVLIQCGDQVRRSKTTIGHHHEAFWNEKFEFELPLSEWNKLASLKMSIMDEEYFKNQGFLGQSIIELGGIISEGEENGSIELLPCSYNVLLEDQSYKGEIKVAFRFTVTKEANGDNINQENAVVKVEEAEECMYTSLLRFFKLPSWWKWRFTFLHTNY